MELHVDRKVYQTMNRTSIVAAVVAVESLLSLTSCSESNDRNDGTDPCGARIGAFVGAVSENPTRYRDELQIISEQIMSMTAADDRLAYYRMLAREITLFDFGKFSQRDREVMSDRYVSPLYGLAKCLAQGGASEQEVGDFVMKWFSRFKELCFPVGVKEYSESDYSDDARRQRMLRRGLRLQWDNDTSVWEHVYIPHVFDRYSQESTKRFLVRWHEEFGCHDKRHHELGK